MTTAHLQGAWTFVCDDQFSVECAHDHWQGGWFTFTSVNKGSDNGIFSAGTANTNTGLHLGERTSRTYHGFHSNDFSPSYVLSANVYYHIVYSFVPRGF
jgi:hypothetical protein